MERVCKSNPFKKYYEEGHNPMCEYIETKCPETGKSIKRKPKSQCFNVEEMTDDELGDFLSPEEKRILRNTVRVKGDGCAEYWKKHEEEKKKKEERLDVLEAREKVWVDYSRQQEEKVKKMENSIEKLASIVSQLLSK